MTSFSIDQFHTAACYCYGEENRNFYVPRPLFFCLPWGCPCGNHAKRCMNEKTIQCLPNPSQHASIFNSFPVIRPASAKKSPFSRTAAHDFVFPGVETPLRLSRNMLHGWKDNAMLAKPLAACTHLFSTVSQLFEPQHVPIYFQ